MPKGRMRNFERAMPFLRIQERLEEIENVSMPHYKESSREAIMRRLSYQLEKISPPRPDWDRVTRLRREMLEGQSKKRKRRKR